MLAISKAQGVTKKRRVAELLRQAGEDPKESVHTEHVASEKKKADGREKHKYTLGWMKSVAAARKELGLAKNAKFPKGSEVYKRAKEIQAAQKDAGSLQVG